MVVYQNKEKEQFEMKVNGETAFIDYDFRNDKIQLNFTEVPQSLRGQGIGSKLVRRTMELIERMDLKIIPECEFVQAWLKRHPEWKYIIADN